MHVEVDIRPNKIYAIDTVTETYRVDGYLETRWQDSRLRFKPAAGQADTRTYEDGNVVAVAGTQVWWPTLEFVNVTGEREVPHRRLIVGANGEIRYEERFHATFWSQMDFREYPFDSQSFKIQLESFSYSDTDVVFVLPVDGVTKPEEAPLEEWEIKSHRGYISDRHHHDPMFPQTYSRFNLEVLAKRKSGYFLWQFFLPLLLIVAASWSVFWISAESDQLSVAFTLMLTVVAFNFYTSTLLPRLPYNTLIELVVISGYITIFCSIVMILVGNFFIHRGREQFGNQIFVICRLLFPLAYVAGIGLLVRQLFG